MKTLIIFCLLIAGFTSAAAQNRERFVRPVDEARKDASFLAFRTKLVAALKRRDSKYLLSVVDRDIKNGFGGDDGIENFKKTWKPASDKSEIWDELTAILTNGGTFSREGGNLIFSAPFVFTEFPADLDAFEHQVIFGNNVNLRAKPDSKAKVVARLSYNIVKVDYQNSLKEAKTSDAYSWLKVTTLGGKQGFVDQKFVRSPIGYRAGFEKKKGVWKLNYLVSGD